MKVTLNGDAVDLEEGATVADVARLVGAEEPGRGVAVAVDGEVVPGSDWQMRLNEGQRVEVVHAVQGG